MEENFEHVPHGLRGANQERGRAHNARLVLSLLRREDGLPRAEIARRTGLTAQAVAGIVRALMEDGLIVPGARLKGRVGQPSVPMHLAPGGAYALGLRIGRRSSEMVLIDFLGAILGRETLARPTPSPTRVLDFAQEAVPRLIGTLGPEQAQRIAGLGVAMPFEIWRWEGADLAAWQDQDIGAALAERLDLPVHVQNDATAAAGAELMFGLGDKVASFAYLYIGGFLGGGLVLGHMLVTGDRGNAGAFGSLPVAGPDGPEPLLARASLRRLAAMAGTEDVDAVPEDALASWIAEAAPALAQAAVAVAALLDLDTVILDGDVPSAWRARLVADSSAALGRLDTRGIAPPTIREGTVGRDARALGGATHPFRARYLLETALPGG